MYSRIKEPPYILLTQTLFQIQRMNTLSLGFFKKGLLVYSFVFNIMFLFILFNTFLLIFLFNLFWVNKSKHFSLFCFGCLFSKLVPKKTLNQKLYEFYQNVPTNTAIHSYRSPPKPGYGFKTSTLPPYIRNGYSSVSVNILFSEQTNQKSLKMKANIVACLPTIST